MDALTSFGLVAVTAMLVTYALEERSPHFILAFAAACGLGSIYGFLQGAWPFGLDRGGVVRGRSAALDASGGKTRGLNSEAASRVVASGGLLRWSTSLRPRQHAPRGRACQRYNAAPGSGRQNHRRRP